MADVLDLLTLSEAKAAVALTNNASFDAELPAWVTAVSRRLDKAVGPIVVRTLTAELHDGGSVEVQTGLWPVTSFTTVTEYASTTATTLTAETNATKPASAYLAERYRNDPSLFSGELVRRSSNSTARFTTGRRNVELTYVAGRFATTAAVDQRFKLAAKIMLKSIWRSQQEATAKVDEYDVPTAIFPTFAVPKAVMDLLHDEWQEDIFGIA